MSAADSAGLDARIVVQRHGFRLDAGVRATSGEVIAVMGPSGAGKSTLLGVLAGLTPLDDGHVRLSGRTLDAAGTHIAPSRRGIVLLGQDPRLFPHLTAHANVAFGLRVHGATKAEAATTAREWLRRVGLADMADRRPARLSGGQQQRVALARALATTPAVLLLDEPLTSLDAETSADVRALVHEQLVATRTTAIVATHDAVDAVSLATRLVVLEAGRVTQEGPVRQVLAAPATRFAAAVAGLNRVEVRLEGDGWRSGALTLARAVGDAPSALPPTGSRAAVFAPGAVSLAPLGSDGPHERPGREGEWIARVTRLEQTPAGVRVRTAEPDVAADIPADRAAALDLTPGTAVRLSVAPGAVRFV
ncbi:sulfate/molybdate ABC transporter ATP-binding protein [Microbacterium salsuginis]|nr:ATP-binding cassette domain-containing protein [Microbacterium sp. CFH 90308]